MANASHPGHYFDGEEECVLLAVEMLGDCYTKVREVGHNGVSSELYEMNDEGDACVFAQIIEVGS